MAVECPQDEMHVTHGSEAEKMCFCAAKGYLVILEKISMNQFMDVKKRLKRFTEKTVKFGLTLNWRKLMLLWKGRFFQYWNAVTIRDILRSHNMLHLPLKEDA